MNTGAVRKKTILYFFLLYWYFFQAVFVIRVAEQKLEPLFGFGGSSSTSVLHNR